MAKSVPSYLTTAIMESGDARAAVLFCLVEAIEEQTKAQERIAVALEQIAGEKAAKTTDGLYEYESAEPERGWPKDRRGYEEMRGI